MLFRSYDACIHVGDIGMDSIIVLVCTEWMVLQSGVGDVLVRFRVSQETVLNLRCWKLYWMMHRMMPRERTGPGAYIRRSGSCTFFPQCRHVIPRVRYLTPRVRRGVRSPQWNQKPTLSPMRYRYAIRRPTVIIAVS